jgi:two-component system CheB/CheR fusion protein
MFQAIRSFVAEREAGDFETAARSSCGRTNLYSLGVVGGSGGEKIAVVDDDYFAREEICGQLQDFGWEVDAFSSCEDFLSDERRRQNTCVVLDIHFPGMSGLELLHRLGERPDGPPIIVVSGSSGISEAVQSMRQGALDFIEKPVARDRLVASVERAFARSRRAEKVSSSREAALGRLSQLTLRQREILDRVLAGQPSKNIAADLGISQRTVENHRASIMKRTGARSLPALAQLVMCNRCCADT